MKGILDDTAITDDERVIHEDSPLRGIWLEPREGAAAVGDGRILTQDQTDVLILTELYAHTEIRNRSVFEQMFGLPDGCMLERKGQPAIRATKQRGGSHSDPLVRVLAFRAWGDRDRRWWQLLPPKVFFDVFMKLAPADPTPIDGHRDHRLIRVASSTESDTSQWFGVLGCQCLQDFYFRPG